MRIVFVNQNKKNCQFFISALKQIIAHKKSCPKNEVFIKVGKDKPLELASHIEDFHQRELPNYCRIIINRDLFTLDMMEEQDDVVYSFSSIYLFRSIKKNQNKIINLALQKTTQGFMSYFHTQNQEYSNETHFDGERVEQVWPTSPFQKEQGIYQIIDVASLKGDIFKKTNTQQYQNMIWLQFSQRYLSIRNYVQEKSRRQDKVSLEELSNYDFTDISSRLNKKVCLAIASQFFVEHFTYCSKKQKEVNLKVLKIFQRSNQEELIGSYLIMTTHMQYGVICKVIECVISQNVITTTLNFRQQLPSNFNQTNARREQRCLLKNEEPTMKQHLRLALNSANHIDAEHKMGQRVWRQRKQYKMQEEEDTVSRKFVFKDMKQ